MSATYVPTGPLRRFVQQIWLFDEPGLQGEERVMPSASAGIIFNLLDQPMRVNDSTRADGWACFRGPVLAGTSSASSFIDSTGWGPMLGVQFRPGGAAPFFGLPQHEARDQTLLLDEVWSADAADLFERVAGAPSFVDQCATIEAYLLDHLDHDYTPNPAVDLALDRFRRRPSSCTVSAVAREAGMSHGRFIDAFRDCTGLTPKRFRRVKRVQRAVHHLFTAPEQGMAGIALRCGYFDQAHFTRDFRSIAGVTPSEYLARRTAHAGHLSAR